MSQNFIFTQIRSLVSLLQTVIRERSYVRASLDDRTFIERAWTIRETIDMVQGRVCGMPEEEHAKLSEMFRLFPYVTRTMQERYWLLDRKDFVLRAMDQQRGTEVSIEFEAAFAAFRSTSEAVGGRLPVRIEDMNPQLNDATTGTGFDRHYLYHPAWAARVLARTKPAEHVDISSILHFATLISAFIRPGSMTIGLQR
jgi:hypothetical protein